MRNQAITTIIIVFSFAILTAEFEPSNAVDPFIGTGGHGHTFPGATAPLGMVKLSPDTDTEGWDWCSGYHHSDNSIMGFSHTHLSGTGASDYGDIMLMPTTGKIQLEPGSKEYPNKGYRSKFSHANETAEPGYYSVHLKDYDIDVELTVSKRAGFHKYSFPETEQANIIMDLKHGIHDSPKEGYVNIINDHTVEGYRRSAGWARDHTVYFVARFSQSFNKSGISKNGQIDKDHTKGKAKNVKAFFQFDAEQNQPILVKVGISHTSLAGARKNLETEIPDWNFSQVKALARKEWNEKLQMIEIEDGIGDAEEIFYTALYHSLIAPHIFTDVNDKYTGMDGKIYQAQDYTHYSVFSLWDTFRSLHPLFNIIEPDRNIDMIKSMLDKYDKSGLLPVWELAANETNCMIGYHSIPVITDAYIKGLDDFNIEKAYQAMKTSAMQNEFGIKEYREYGYIPSDLEHESVSKTLEYAYDDWCIAQIAKKLEKTEDYESFIKRSQFHKNIFDEKTGFMRAKKRGKWRQPFDPYSVSGDYTEANAWQYSFFAPQDVQGLVELYGGKEHFASQLDKLFSAGNKLTGRKQVDISGLIGQYAHGNEPSHHMAYLYSYADREWQTQSLLRKIMTEFYTTKTNGLAGNEDCGQMSAWYIFSAMGLYPVSPGSDYYVIGTPMFKEIKIPLDNQNTIRIIAKNLKTDNKYVKELYVNGKPWEKSFLEHETLMDGCNIEFIMTDKPVKDWFIKNELLAKSDIARDMAPVPYFKYNRVLFQDSNRIELECIDDKAEIYYTKDGKTPTEDSEHYQGQFNIDNSCEIVARAFKKNEIPSVTAAVKFKKVAFIKEIKLNTKYAERYSAGGDNALVNSIYGTKNYWTGEWQGYKGVNLDVIVDLKKSRPLEKIAIRFLQDIGAWIFMPEKIEFFVSNNGKNFKKVETQKSKVPATKSGVIIKKYTTELTNTKVRYIRIKARNREKCPSWHKGAGRPAWIFSDEIIISIDN